MCRSALPRQRAVAVPQTEAVFEELTASRQHLRWPMSSAARREWTSLEGQVGLGGTVTGGSCHADAIPAEVGESVPESRARIGVAELTIESVEVETRQPRDHGPLTSYPPIPGRPIVGIANVNSQLGCDQPGVPKRVSGQSQKDLTLIFRISIKIRAPLVHKVPSQLEEVAAEVGRLGCVAHRVCQGRLDDRVGRAGLLRRPVPEA